MMTPLNYDVEGHQGIFTHTLLVFFTERIDAFNNGSIVTFSFHQQLLDFPEAAGFDLLPKLFIDISQ